MKKRMIALGTILALTAAMAAGCGNSSSDSSADTAEATESAEATDETAEETEEASGKIPSADEIEIPEGTTIRIGYLAQNETDQFNVIMSNALKAEAEAFGGKVEVVMTDAQSIAATQVSQSEDMIVQEPDVVIINAIDREACAPAVDNLTEAGIPVVALNTEVSNLDLCESYVGTDPVESGVFAMELMADALGEEGGTVNLIQGVLGHPGNEDRMTGIQETVVNYDNIEIGKTQAADWDRNKAMNVTEDWLSSSDEFNGIIAMNDEMAISAANTLISAGRDDVKVIGIDAIEEALEMVKEGKMYGTVFQDAVAQGAGSTDIAVCVALGIPFDAEYMIPYEKVTAENVDDYMGENDNTSIG